MKYTADESVDFGIIENLRQAGMEVYSISEELSGIPDIEVLRIAFKSQSLLLTEDKDFGELVYRLKLKHRGILLIRLSNLPRPERILLVFKIIDDYSGTLLDNFSVLTKNGLTECITYDAKVFLGRTLQGQGLSIVRQDI